MTRPPSQLRLRRAAACALVCLLAAAGAAPADEPELRRVDTRVRYLGDGMVYLDAGRRDGIKVGDTLLITLSDGREERLRITATAERSSSASLVPTLVPLVNPGQPATVLARPAPPAPPVSAAPVGGSAGPGQGRGPQDPSGLWENAQPAWPGALSGSVFRPLLAPVATPEATQAREERDAFLVDGRLTLSAFRVEDTQVDRDWTRLRAYADMEVSRLAGTDWRAVIRLSTNAQFEAEEDDTYQLRMHELYLEHLPRDQTHRLRLGRFFFEPLPGVGQLDGLHGEIKLGSSPVLVGAAGGFLPTGKRETPDYHRGGGVLYTTLRTDPLASTGIDASFGYFGTVDDSEFDRSALMGRQSLRLADTVYLTAMETIDFYDTDDYRQGIRLTRAFADLRVQIVRQLAVGVGYDRNELPDTAANRELYTGLRRPGDTRGERYYVYANQYFQPGWSFSQRVALVTRRTRKNQTALTLSFAKLGVFAPGDSIRAGYYGLFGGETDTHSPYLELTKELVQDLSVWGRYRLQLISPPLGDDLTQHELSLGATWLWGDLYFQAEGSYTTGDEVKRYRGFLSVTWRF